MWKNSIKIPFKISDLNRFLHSKNKKKITPSFQKSEPHLIFRRDLPLINKNKCSTPKREIKQFFSPLRSSYQRNNLMRSLITPITYFISQLPSVLSIIILYALDQTKKKPNLFKNKIRVYFCQRKSRNSMRALILIFFCRLEKSKSSSAKEEEKKKLIAHTSKI